MVKRIFSLIVVVIGFLFVLTACSQSAAEPAVVTKAPVATKAPAAEVQEATKAPAQFALSGDPIRGGQLYDHWIEVLGVDTPADSHALWGKQTTNTRKGADTWRCKECHGWDYKGSEGAYGSGSHKTGFVGVIQVAGKDPSGILASLKGGTNPDHDFSAVMDDQALTDLALFLSKDMLDTTAIIMDKKPVGGDPAKGKTIYGENCIDCHGENGMALNFADESGPEYIGVIAASNPWEFVHKARFGQPQIADMPPLIDRSLADKDYLDLLAYTQSLPTSSPISEGARLYDNWILATGAENKTESQPLWATQTTNTRTGNDTWRCKECHGWDYLGVDGRYGSGSHKTGFPGIYSAKGKTADELLVALKSDKHDYSTLLNDNQLNALVAFMQQMQDLKPYINADKTTTGNVDHGKSLYDGNCKMCHAEDGKALDFADGEDVEYVGTLAADNPWEAINKIAYGQPGHVMTAGINMGWTWKDMTDILAYIQTLPIK